MPIVLHKQAEEAILPAVTSPHPADQIDTGEGQTEVTEEKSLQQFLREMPLSGQIPLILLGGLCIVLFTLGVASVIRGEASETRVYGFKHCHSFFSNLFSFERSCDSYWILATRIIKQSDIVNGCYWSSFLVVRFGVCYLANAEACNVV